MSTPGDLDRSRILLVEDNRDDYLLVEAILPEDEYQIIWCRNAREARSQLADGLFDLVLLDHGLPDVNGLSFLEELRSKYPGQAVVVLTGRDDQALAVSALKLGAHTYLLKDEILDHLVDTLKEALPRRQSAHVYKRAESRPRFVDTAERFYQVVMETMDEGCLVVDPEGVIMYANPALNALLSCDSKSLPGRSALELFAPQAADNVDRILAHFRAARTSRSIVTEAALAADHARARDGVAMVRIAMRSMHRPDGSFEAGLLILTDVSELLRAKQLLAARYLQEKAQHGRLRAVLESSRDGILLVDRNLCLRVVNGPVAALLNLPGGAEHWTGRSLIDLLRVLRRSSRDLAHIVMREVRRIGDGDETPADGEVTLGSRALRWADLPVQGDDSRLLVLQDVTAEREVLQMREDLVHMAVHDLRSPLNVIAQSLEQVQELAQSAQDATPAGDPGPLSDAESWVEVDEWLGFAMQGVRRMMGLVSSILDASRLEQGELPLAREVCALGPLMRQAVHEQSSVAAARQVTLVCDDTAAHAQVWRALIDPELIARVLQNLLDNAIRSTPPGGSVSLRAEPWPGRDSGAPDADGRLPRHYCLVVADDGPGIPPEMEGRLFGRFATNRRQGAGLGLAFCKLAVEAHGGEIWADSPAGRGAVFRFTVPIAIS
jgi:PAS domain S-box-containing protein